MRIFFTAIFQIIYRISPYSSDCDISAGTTFFLTPFFVSDREKNIHSERVKNFQCMSYRFGTIPNIYSLDFPQFLILLDLFPMQKDAGCFGVEIPPYY